MGSSEPVLLLKPGREKSLLRRHPWVFSGAVASVDAGIRAGETVRVTSQAGEFLGRGAYSPESQIRVRIWSWKENEPIDEDFFFRRLLAAYEGRKRLLSSEETTALRLAHGESDGLPGLIIDRYDRWLVFQFLSRGAEARRGEILLAMRRLLPNYHGYERSDVDVRRLEGLPERSGTLWGEPPVEPVVIAEHGLSFLVDLQHGHKTGFYLDQRENRLRVRRLAEGAEVLDCFAYSGGFTINALAGGARQVTALEASAEALALARRNLSLNGLDEQPYDELQDDAFAALRELRDRGRSFDLVILDPPKFAPTSAQVAQAARGYKDINLLALKLLRPGGELVTFSCSGGVDAELFQKIVAGAALDAGVEPQIVGRLGQSADHPVALNFPEGEYLKGLILRKI